MPSIHDAPGHGKAHPLRFLDGYQAYSAVTEIHRDNGPWPLVYCWTHVRRRFERAARAAADRGSLSGRENRAAKPRPSAWQPGASIRPRSLPRSSPGSRRSCRASRKNPNWPRTSATRWRVFPGLARFLENGTFEMDTNPVEHQIRPIALTRKNALFAGNGTGAESWAMFASLVATCKLADANPVDDIAATLRAILDGHPKNAIEDLMPWRFNQPSTLTT